MKPGVDCCHTNCRSCWHNARRRPVKPEDTVSRTVFSGVREHQEERSGTGMRKWNHTLDSLNLEVFLK